jgi:hypothetical protein
MTQLARRDARYDEVRAVRDDQGHERVLLARRAAGRQGG